MVAITEFMTLWRSTGRLEATDVRDCSPHSQLFHVGIAIRWCEL